MNYSRGLLAIALSCTIGSVALAQTSPGTSPLSGKKGGTNNAFMQFSGPAISVKTYTLANASDAIALLGQIETWTGAQSFTDGTLVLLGSSSGSSTLKAPATGGGTATLFSGADTIAGIAATQTLTNKTLTSPIISQIFGGTAVGSSVTVQSTNNGAPSGDVASLLGSTVTLGNPINGASIINLAGPLGGGVTVNIASSGNGLNALNVFNSTGGKQVWVPGPGAGVTPGTITFPAATDQLVARNTTDTLTNKTINGGSNTFCLPNRQIFTTGTNATYTTPTCNAVLPTRIEWEFVGGGGGGAGSGTTPGAATAGGSTCVNTSSPACTTPLFVTTGGALGSASAGATAAGGTATSCDLGLTGGTGGGGTSLANQYGGAGGSSFFGGQGYPGSPGSTAGIAAVANTGSGGGGGGDAATANSGGGGGAGGYCRKIQTSPASSYFYTVGAAGAAGGAGTSGVVGGAGAAGLIIATAYWQ